MASDIDATISTFGWSLSAGMDLDSNEYPDLLIGAYESANAVYLRSAPVVHLDSKVTSFPQHSITYSFYVSLNLLGW